MAPCKRPRLKRAGFRDSGLPAGVQSALTMKSHFKKYLLIAVGSVSLALGILGILVPVLPTTPFLLLASFCYLRSSKRLYGWMLNNRVFGRYVHDYLAFRAVKRSVKAVTLALLWTTLAVSIALSSSFYLRMFLIAVGVGVSIHVLSLKTLRARDHDG